MIFYTQMNQVLKAYALINFLRSQKSSNERSEHVSDLGSLER